MAAEVKIILRVDDQGAIQVLKDTTQEVQNLGAAGQSAGAAGAAGAAEMGAAFARVLGIYAAITAAAYEFGHAASNAFKSAFKNLDDYNVMAIGAAASLTNLTTVGAHEMMAAYGQYKVYVLEMYKEIGAETSRHFSSGKEMLQTFNALARYGIMAHKEDANAIGVITDQVRILHGGYLNNMTVLHELRGLMEGYAGHHYRLAQVLRNQLGPGWHDLVVEHMKAGDLLQWMGSLFPGLMAANKDIQNTYTAQHTTLTTILNQIGRAGVAGAYADIVGWAKLIKDYLEAHKALIGGGIARGWQVVKDLAQGTWGFIKDIAALANKGIVVPITFVIKGVTSGIGAAAKWLAEGAGPGGDYGFGALQPKIDYMESKEYWEGYESRRAAYQAETLRLFRQGAEPPPTKIPDLGDEKGAAAGKGLETAQRQLENFISTMQSEIARGAGDSLAVLEAWYNKQAKTLDELEEKLGAQPQAWAALTDAKVAKERGIYEKYYDYLGKESGNFYKEEEARAAKALREFAGIAGAKEAITEASNRRIGEKEAKQQIEVLGLQKGWLANLAQAAPLLSQQLALEAQALPLTQEMERLSLAEKLAKMQITDAEKAQLRGLQALTHQAQLYTLEMKKWETQGIAGGLQLGLRDLKRESETAASAFVRQLVVQVPHTMEDALAQGLVGAFHKEKGMAKKFFDEAVVAGIRMGVQVLMIPVRRLFTTALEAGIKLVAPFLTSVVTTVFGEAAGKAVGSMLGAGMQTAAEAPLIAALAQLTAGIGLLMPLVAGSNIAVASNTVALGANTTALSVMTVALAAMPFHTGGLVAHQGLIVAHAGLNLASDERLAKLQTGEGVLSRADMAFLGREGWEAIRSRQMPVVAAPLETGPGGRAGQTVHVEVHRGAIEEHHHYRNPVTLADAHRAKKVQLRAWQNHLKRLGMF